MRHAYAHARILSDRAQYMFGCLLSQFILFQHRASPECVCLVIVRSQLCLQSTHTVARIVSIFILFLNSRKNRRRENYFRRNMPLLCITFLRLCRKWNCEKLDLADLSSVRVFVVVSVIESIVERSLSSVDVDRHANDFKMLKRLTG